MKTSSCPRAIPSLLCAGALLLSGAAMAETTLTSNDGSFSLVGELLGVDDENYTIRTQLGELIVRREFVRCSGDGCPDDGAEDAGSREVVLQSLDGNIRLSGELVRTTDTDYVINTVSGELVVRKEFVACEGAACPDNTIDSSSFVVAVPSSFGRDILTRIMGDFATSKGYSLTENIGSGDSLASLLMGNERGEEVASISVDGMDRTEAITAVLNGGAAFALTRDRVDLDTLSRLTRRTVSDVSDVLNEQTVGLDAVSFVMHQSNQIDIVSIAQIRNILLGRIGNWSQLGGKDEAITVHMLANAAGIDEKLQARVLNGAEVRNAVLHDSAAALNAAVAGDPGAFGVLYRSQIDGAKMASLVSQCRIYFDNSDFAVQTEEYPLVVRWYQYSAKVGNAPDVANNVRDFTVTDFGQKAAASQGLVTQELRIRAMNDQGARLLTSMLADDTGDTSSRVTRDYLSRVADAKRISTSLRFLSGSTTLDSKAIGDVRRISEIIRSPDYAGYEFLVVGFSDSFGAFGANLNLSLRRAQAVQEILLRENSGYLDRGDVEVLGVGPIAPVDCNDSEAGRDLNRRVEIWVRPKA